LVFLSILVGVSGQDFKLPRTEAALNRTDALQTRIDADILRLSALQIEGADGKSNPSPDIIRVIVLSAECTSQCGPVFNTSRSCWKQCQRYSTPTCKLANTDIDGIPDADLCCKTYVKQRKDSATYMLSLIHAQMLYDSHPREVSQS
jgi:hypothetical protein